MQFTNKFGYPEEIVLAVTNDPYDKGDSEFSATGLITPARISALKKKHDHELVVDVDDRLFALYGQVGHGILERAGMTLSTKLVERRLFTVIAETKISAQIDNLSLSEDGTLRDWKFTSVVGFKKGKPPKWEWVAQLNIQIELLRREGFEPKRAQIWGILRDWRPKEARDEPNIYPTKCGFHDIPIAPRDKIVNYIETRIKAHRAAEKDLPLCSAKDNWNGNRCASYCDVNKFCDQYNKKTTRRD